MRVKSVKNEQTIKPKHKNGSQTKIHLQALFFDTSCLLREITMFFQCCVKIILYKKYVIKYRYTGEINFLGGYL